MSNFWKWSQRPSDTGLLLQMRKRDDSHTFAISFISDSIIKFYGCLPTFLKTSHLSSPAHRRLWKKVFEFSRHYRTQLDREMNFVIYNRRFARTRSWDRPFGPLYIFHLTMDGNFEPSCTATAECNPFWHRIDSVILLIYVYTHLFLYNYFSLQVFRDLPYDEIDASPSTTFLLFTNVFSFSHFLLLSVDENLMR